MAEILIHECRNCWSQGRRNHAKSGGMHSGSTLTCRKGQLSNLERCTLYTNALNMPAHLHKIVGISASLAQSAYHVLLCEVTFVIVISLIDFKTVFILCYFCSFLKRGYELLVSFVQNKVRNG